jgi:diadenosine tetraphosphatase ApaH/serine/threonine PP2A family protein phosphatase
MVLANAQGDYDQVLCCGDLVGYSAEPNEVVSWARANAKAVIRGNHDRACSGDAGELEWFNPTARAAAVWTRKTLTPENAAWLARLPRGPLPIDGFQLLHGSPVDEDEYVVSTFDAAPLSGYIEWPLSFFGHTHLQGGFFYRHNGVRRLMKPGLDEAESVFYLQPDTKYLVNPGSVGQPRDGDPRAAYCIYDQETRAILFRRVAYDIEDAQRQIRTAGLPESLAARLAAGS